MLLLRFHSDHTGHIYIFISYSSVCTLDTIIISYDFPMQYIIKEAMWAITGACVCVSVCVCLRACVCLCVCACVRVQRRVN